MFTRWTPSKANPFKMTDLLSPDNSRLEGRSQKSEQPWKLFWVSIKRFLSEPRFFMKTFFSLCLLSVHRYLLPN